MTDYAFIGPSLSVERARSIAPQAVLRPPAERGSLFREDLAPGDRVLIVDGYYGHRPAIAHLEILDAMRRGAIVAGASSIGALRAAELTAFGMCGYGRVYEAYARGELRGDDEVAVMHDAETYRMTSAPLVNLRANIDRAVTAGVVEPSDAAWLVEHLRQRWFGERSYAAAIHAARERAPRLREFWREGLVDLKAEDAEGALARLGDLEPAGTPPPAETVFAHALRAEVRRAADDVVSDGDVLALCRAYATDAARIAREASILSLLERLDPAFARHGYSAKRDAALAAAAARGVTLEMLAVLELARCGFVAEGSDETVLDGFVPAASSPDVPDHRTLFEAFAHHGYVRPARRALEVCRAKAFAARSDADVRFDRLSDARLVELYAGRWGVAPDAIRAEARARGFLSERELFGSAGKALVAVTIARLMRAGGARRSVV
jgi:hypothetical protein